MRSIYCILATLAFVGAASAQTVPDITVNYEGLFELNSPISGCGTDFTVGQSGRILYRYKNGDANLNDAIVFHFDRSSYRMTGTTAGGSLNGNTTSNNQIISSSAGFKSDTTGSSNLLIASTNPTLTIPTTANIKINGTVDNFFFHAGCTVTIKSVLLKSVNQ